MEREHAWIIETENPHPMWEERTCAVCELKDQRSRDRRPPRSDWEVTTPCIEPVPDTVTYEALLAELALHNVKEQPHVMGHPGSWHIGFFIGRGRVYPSYWIEAPRTLEHGFAKLLRWVRARQYNVRLYSDIAYQHDLANPPYRDDD